MRRCIRSFNGGRGIAQDFFVAGAFEELDDAREFYFNASTRTGFTICVCK